MEIQALRKIVHDKLRDTNDIKNRKISTYIKSHDMTHTENKNGIFVNISLCPEEHIRAIYNIINLNDVPDTHHMDRYIPPGEAGTGTGTGSGTGTGTGTGTGSGLGQALSDLATTYPAPPETLETENNVVDYSTTALETLILQYSFT